MSDYDNPFDCYCSRCREDYFGSRLKPEARKVVSIRELVDGHNRLGNKRYRHLYVFADNVFEIEMLAAGAKLPVSMSRDGRFYFTVDADTSNPTNYCLTICNGVVRLDTAALPSISAVPSLREIGADERKLLADNIVAAAKLKGTAWDPSLILGLLRNTSNNPNRIFPLCFKDNNWVVYDGGLLDWMKTALEIRIKCQRCGNSVELASEFEPLRFRWCIACEAAIILGKAESDDRADTSTKTPHLPECNNWKGAIGDPGCICIVVNRNEYAKLVRAAKKDGK